VAITKALGNQAGFAGSVNGDTVWMAAVTLADQNGNALGLADNADGVAASATADKIGVSNRLYSFNGATFDRLRGDTNALCVQPALSATFWNFAGIAGGIVSSTADTALKAAAGAGVRNYLKSLAINHDTLSAVTECVVKDGAAIIWRGKLQTPVVDSAAGAGAIIFDPPLRGTANTALNFALLTSVTGGVFINAQGYTGA
jgi:hypothetical protein